MNSEGSTDQPSRNAAGTGNKIKIAPFADYLASTHTAGVRPAGRESGSDERRRDPAGRRRGRRRNEERGDGGFTCKE